MQKWQTHFEQVPLEKIEKIIEEEIRPEKPPKGKAIKESLPQTSGGAK
jgi:hypothetical protein